MLHYIKIPKLVLYDLDWLLKLKNHWVAKDSQRLICEIYTKTKFYKIVHYLLTSILSKTKKVTAVLEIFSFLAMVNWIQFCTNFNLLNLMRHFVLPFHCWASFNFQALFLLFRVSPFNGCDWPASFLPKNCQLLELESSNPLRIQQVF